MDGDDGHESRRARERGADPRETWEEARRARFAEIAAPPDDAGTDGESDRSGNRSPTAGQSGDGTPGARAGGGDRNEDGRRREDDRPAGGGSDGGWPFGRPGPSAALRGEADRRTKWDKWDSDEPTSPIQPVEWQALDDQSAPARQAPRRDGAAGGGQGRLYASGGQDEKGGAGGRDPGGREGHGRDSGGPDGQGRDPGARDEPGARDQPGGAGGRDPGDPDFDGTELDTMGRGEPPPPEPDSQDADPDHPFDWLTSDDPADSGRLEDPGRPKPRAAPAPGATAYNTENAAARPAGGQRASGGNARAAAGRDADEPAPKRRWGWGWFRRRRDREDREQAERAETPPGHGQSARARPGDEAPDGVQGGDPRAGEAAEPPLPTEPGGSGTLDPCPEGDVDPADQAVWADEPESRVWAPARAAAGTSAAARTGTTRARPAQGQPAGRGTDPRRAAVVQRRQPARARRGTGRRAGRRGPSAARRRWWRIRSDVYAVVVYLLGAVYVLERLLPDPAGRVQLNVPDQTFFQWMLAYGSQVVSRGADPLFTTRIGDPIGVNMMANTSVLGISIPLAPITLLFGAPVAYVVFSLLALAGTATAWYYVLSRHVVRSRMAAAVGGGLAGFAPAMISHSYGHPNIVAQFLVPFIVWRAVCLREQGHWLRNGLLLGLLITWQAFINEEVLLIVAIGLIFFVLSYCAMRPSVVPREALTFLRGLLVAVVVAGALLAYPLYAEFRGPQHGTGANTAGPRPYPADLLSFPAFSGGSLAGSPKVIGRLAQNISEQNAFFGWPLLVLLALMTILMRRSRVYLSGLIVVLVLTALSLGSHITIGGRDTGVGGPWSWVAHAPLFRQVVPTRVAVDIAPVLAVLLALAYDRVAAIHARDPLGPGNLVWHGALIAVLIPLVPVPLRTSSLPPVPPFITQGVWRQYVDDHHSLVGIPSAQIGRLEPMRWSMLTNTAFSIPAGYYLAPNGSFGSPPRATSTLLDAVANTGRVPEIGPDESANALTDLRYWRASAVFVVPGYHTDQVNEAASELFGFRPRWVSGVWVWDVRDLLAQ